jgi:S1-C subfamily serine protease
MTNPTPSALAALSSGLGDVVEALTPSLATVLGRRQDATATAWAPDLLVTAHHNLPRHGVPRVRLPDGTVIDATVRGRDPGTDLALLQVAAELPVSEWVDTGGRVGELVLALGRTESVRATWGVISNTSGPWRTGWGGQVDRFLDVDASLPRGFSGGPLVAADGTLLGLNTRGLLRGGTTLPTPTLRRVLDQLAEHGSVQRGWIGVGVHAVDLDGDGAQITAQDRALLLTQVVSGGPAAQAGLRQGDLLLTAGEVPLGASEDLLGALVGAEGQEIEVRYLRGGAILRSPVTPGARPGRKRAC